MRDAISFRLLCVSHYFESHRGGIEMVAGRLARTLAKTGMNVTWAACDASPPPTDIRALPLRASNLIERRSGLPFPLLRVSSIIRLVHAIRASHAVLVHDGMYPSSIVGIIIARLCRRPVILVQHIGRVPAPTIGLRFLFTVADRVLTRFSLRLASQVVFISATSARHFAKMKMRREPALIFNGVDADIFHPSMSENERAHERQQIGWPADRPVALFVGRFLEKKGLLRLREMAKARPDVHWAFAGWGPCDPQNWALVNVSVHRNRSAAQLAQLYRSADLLLLPSKSEGFPLVVQEGLACGLRILCCDDAAQADAKAAPYLCGIPNSDDEAAIIASYLRAADDLFGITVSDDERRARALFARNRYSWGAAALSYAALLESLCAAMPANFPDSASVSA